jgi:molecular chaperone GrpE
VEPKEAKRKSSVDDNEQPEIRVTDRRRIYLNDEANSKPDESTSLKPSYVEELEARTLAAENQLQEVQNRFEQLRAELQRETDETRKRLNRAADERADREKANFIVALLPVLDDLQRAAKAAQTSSSTQDIAEGVRQIAEAFDRALTAAGVEPIQTLGEQFNPEIHEAVETVSVGNDEDNVVMGEYSRGYRMGDKLLRPARVKVGSSSLKSDSASQ